MSNDSIKKTLGVAFAVCIVCSVMVSAAAVALRPLQEANKARETKKNILQAAGIYEPGMNIEEGFKVVEPRLVDLATGNFVEGDPVAYDTKKESKDPKKAIHLDADQDIAKIRQIAPKQVVYLLKKDGQLQTLILPVYGKGLWSTMYAFVALSGDANTVKGLSFYEHGETPGLGGEVDNPLWKAQWPGKKLFDKQGHLKIQLVKGGVDPSKPGVQHKVDGLSGATLTARGVEDLIRFWMGKEGYGPLLEQIRKQGA
ncbi:MAG: Na(+)-translocating NADH-quinone reductase subunit C [bacterium]|nr:Na(+)-translocating NADH-quinone reductase subunit C [bacterium]